MRTAREVAHDALCRGGLDVCTSAVLFDDEVLRLTREILVYGMDYADAARREERASCAQAARDYSAGRISAGKFAELLGLDAGERHEFKNRCGAFREPEADTEFERRKGEAG